MKTERVTTILVMALISLMSLALLASYLDAPYDGYQAFNEAWNSLIAENYDQFSWFEPHPYEDTLDLNTPPFYSYALNLSYVVFGGQEWAFRLVSVVMGLLCVIMTFFIARELYGLRAGLASAALLAVCPVFVITARNVQPDGMFLCFMLYGFHFYVQYLRNKNPGTMVFAAIFFGGAIFTRQVALLALIALAISELINNQWKIVNRHRLVIFIAILAVIPGHYYLYHLFTHPGALFTLDRYSALASAEIPSLATLGNLFAEMFFGFGPLLFLLGALALVVNIFARRKQNPIIIWPLMLYLGYYLLVHKHTYFMLPMAPFLCIIIGRYLSELRLKTVGGLALALAAAASLVQSLMLLGAIKYGYNRFEPLCRHVRSSKGDKVLIVDDAIMRRYEPVLRFYCRDVHIDSSTDWQRKFLPGLLPLRYGEVSYFFLDYKDKKAVSDSAHMHFYNKNIMGPLLFGHLLYFKPLREHNATRTFIPGALHMQTVPSHNVFEMHTALVQPGYQMEELPPGVGVFKRTPTEIHKGMAPLFYKLLPLELPAYDYEVEE